MTDTPNWMPLYVAEFIRATVHLSPAEVGAYVRLIAHAWDNGGELPEDKKRLFRITGMTPLEWSRSKAVLLSFFTPVGDTLRHKRVDEELEKAGKLIEQKRAAGKASAAKRAQQPFNSRSTGVATATPTASQPNTTTRFLTGGEAADSKGLIFSEGLKLLTSTGKSDGSARALLGKLRKAAGDDRLATLIAQAKDGGFSDPGAWLSAAVAKPANDQDAFYASINQRFGKPAAAAQ